MEHEILDYTVKSKAVVKSFIGEGEKIRSCNLLNLISHKKKKIKENVISTGITSKYISAVKTPSDVVKVAIGFGIVLKRRDFLQQMAKYIMVGV